jgi:hypothetical protein
VLHGVEVLAAIDFDDQMRLYADEVDDVGTHRNLATKVVPSDLVAAYTHPEIDFSIGHPGAELAPSLKFGTGPEAHFSPHPALPRKRGRGFY